MPKNPFPIFVIGAGSIVKQAHLPAYAKAGWEIYGIFDINVEKASALAAVYGIPRVFPELEKAIQTAPMNVVFDIAVPASELKAILSLLPPNVGVLMQKPFGETIEEAKELLEICKQKNLN